MKSNLNNCVSKDTCQKSHQKNNNSSNLLKETQKSFNDSMALKLGRGIALDRSMFSKKFFSILMGSLILASSSIAEEPEIPKYLGGGSSGGTKITTKSVVGVALDSMVDPVPLIPDSVLLAELKKRGLKIDPKNYRGIYDRARDYRLDDLLYKLPVLDIEGVYDRMQWFTLSRKDFKDNPQLYRSIMKRYFSTESGTKKPIFQMGNGRNFVLVNEDVFESIRTQDIPTALRKLEEETGKKLDPNAVFKRIEEQAWIHEGGRYLVEAVYGDSLESDYKVAKLDNLIFSGEDYSDEELGEVLAQVMKRSRYGGALPRSKIVQGLAQFELKSFTKICSVKGEDNRVKTFKDSMQGREHIVHLNLQKNTSAFSNLFNDSFKRRAPFHGAIWWLRDAVSSYMASRRSVGEKSKVSVEMMKKYLKNFCSYADLSKWSKEDLSILEEAEAYRKKNASAQPILKSIKTALGSTAEKTNKGAVVQGRARSVKAVKPAVTPTSSRTLKLKGTAGKADL